MNATPAITHDIDRCIGRLSNIKANIKSTDYSEQRKAAGMCQEMAAELLIELAETLAWLTDAETPSKTDRNNIRAYVHDGFVEAVEAADERGLTARMEAAE